jgi:ATP-dependent DNA ligase
LIYWPEWRRPQSITSAEEKQFSSESCVTPRTTEFGLLITSSIGEGLVLFAELDQMNLEGMVAKRIDSQYTGGRTREWLKIKTTAGKEEMRKRIETW